MKEEIYLLLEPGDLIAFDHASLGRLILPLLDMVGLGFIEVEIRKAESDIWDFHDERIGPPF